MLVAKRGANELTLSLSPQPLNFFFLFVEAKFIAG